MRINDKILEILCRDSYMDFYNPMQQQNQQKLDCFRHDIKTNHHMYFCQVANQQYVKQDQVDVFSDRFPKPCKDY